jgi:membrane fusion protein, multidrug efflux system
MTMKRPARLLFLLPLYAGALATGCNKAQGDRSQADTAITYDLPVTRTITDYEEFPGGAEPIISIQVTSRVSGYMNEVHFKDGDLVNEGDILFQIDPRQYKAELERAIGNFEQIAAHKARLEREYQRAKMLRSRGSISVEEYDRYESDFKETEANLTLAQANRDLADLNYRWCEVRAGKSGLLSRRLVDPGNLVKAEATVLTSIVTLDPIYVYFDVNERAMLRIQRLLDEAKAKAQSVKEVPVQISLSDEGDDFPHKGFVDFTDNKVDINTGTLRFRAKLDNKDRSITPGMFVRVRLPIGDPHPAVLIPEEALVTDQGEKGVYIVRERDAQGQPYPNDEDKKGTEFFNDKKPLVQRAFWSKVGVPGTAHDGFVEVASGVRPGDWVVVNGTQRLRNGRVVKAEKFLQDVPQSDRTAQKKAAEPKTKQADIFVAYDLSKAETVTEYEHFPGESEAIYSIQVTPRVSGYMTQVYFKDGDPVKAGDLLFKIDPQQYKAELDRAKGTLQQMAAHKVRLEKEYRRAKNLVDRGSISPEEFDRFESDWKETDAGVKLAGANRDLAQLNYDWCEVRAGISGRLSRRMVDPGNQVKADETVLTSIVSLEPIYVYFDVHEQALLRIQHLMQKRKGKARSLREVPVEISLSDEGDDDYLHKGYVDFTDNKVDISTGTLKFRAKLENKDHLLTPGLFVRVRLPIGDTHPAVVIRERALVTQHGKKGIFIVRERDENGKPYPNGKNEKGDPVYLPDRPLAQLVFWTPIGNPGVSRGGYVEIERGLRVGEKVVVSGMQRLANADRKPVKAEKYVERTPTNETEAAPIAADRSAANHPETALHPH